MTVATSVIVAITILGCCLVITSALLVYKLRPDVRQFSAKWSGYSSEPPSPVRKMTVVRGVVVEDDVKRPSRAFLPRWSTLYASRRSSIASSLGSHTSPLLGSQVDLEAQLGHGDEKIPQVNVQEYLGFEKSRRARKIRQHRTQSMKIPPPITLGRDSFSTDDELRVSPDAFSPKTLPLSAPAALPSEGTLKDIASTPLATSTNEPIRRHSTPASALLDKPQTRGPFNVAFLQAASISALPPTAYSARATPEPSIRSFMPEIPEADKVKSAELASLLEHGERAREEELRISRQTSRDLETIIEMTAEPDTAAAPPPVVPLSPRNLRPKSRSSSRPMSRKIREGSLLQRLGRNRPPPIRLGTVTNTNDPSNIDELSESQQAVGMGEFKNPFSNTSAPITPPVLSASIVNGIPSYPAFVPSAAKNRQSTTTISSSQYSPTFSLASAQRVPLFAGKLSPSETCSSLPNVPVVVPSSGMIPSVPAPSYKNAAGLRKSREPSATTEVSAFPKPPSSLHNSPVSSTFSPQYPPAGKRIHGVSPLVNGSSAPILAVNRAPVTTTKTNLPPERPRRPSRYSHLIDKDLPAPPPSSTIVATLLETHLRPHAQGASQEAKIAKQKLPLPQSPKPLPMVIQRKSIAEHLPRQASSSQETSQPLPVPARHPLRAISPSTLSSAVQKTHKSIQDPKPPVIPHVRSQSLSSKASSETQQANFLAETAASAKYHAHNDSALASSPTISPLDAGETAPRNRSASQTASSSVTSSNKPLPAVLQLDLNLDLSGGSELGLDFGRGAFGL